MIPNLKDIREAHDRIRSMIHRTPVMSSQFINQELGAQIYFKCENFQKAGAFKFRGATNSCLLLNKEELAHGVGTHSSGNHAGALAKVAQLLGAKAHIVMPSNSPEVKKRAVAGYGAKIYYCEPNLLARENTMEQVIDKTGCTFIHPYDRFEIIAGQGTAAIELLEEHPDLDIIMAPVGGGGLLSGTAIAAKSLFPDIKVLAGEPLGANDAWQSFRKKKLIPSDNPVTMADGLLTSLSDMTFDAIQEYVDDILLCKEESIVAAMQLVWERMKIIIEPSSAVPLASLMENREKWTGKKVGIILSGGNVDLGNLPF